MIEKIVEEIKNHGGFTFFGGAGTSTGSGIPDFRGADGLFNKKDFEYNAEKMLSHSFFSRSPQKFYKFYRKYFLFLEATPNQAHCALSDLEEKGYLKTIITQNIDNLHQTSGSRNVIELHGTNSVFYCIRCGKRYSLDEIRQSKDVVPTCSCKGIIRPNITLYEENLDNKKFIQAEKEIRNTNVLIVAGTSLKVYPAAGLVEGYHGDHLYIINQQKTHLDNVADCVLREDVSVVLNAIKEALI